MDWARTFRQAKSEHEHEVTPDQLAAPRAGLGPRPALAAVFVGHAGCGAGWLAVASATRLSRQPTIDRAQTTIAS